MSVAVSRAVTSFQEIVVAHTVLPTDFKYGCIRAATTCVSWSGKRQNTAELHYNLGGMLRVPNGSIKVEAVKITPEFSPERFPDTSLRSTSGLHVLPRRNVGKGVKLNLNFLLQRSRDLANCEPNAAGREPNPNHESRTMTMNVEGAYHRVRYSPPATNPVATPWVELSMLKQITDVVPVHSGFVPSGHRSLPL